MKTNNLIKTSIMRPALVTVGVLLIPFIAMQIGDEWSWTISDFLIMGVLVFCAGFLIEQVITKIEKTAHKIMLMFLLVLTFLYVWAELAVGIFTKLGS